MATRQQRFSITTIASLVGIAVVCASTIGWAYAAEGKAERAEIQSTCNDQRLDDVEQVLVRIETRQEAQIKAQESHTETLKQIETHLRRSAP